MKKIIGIALITLGLTSCGGGKYIPCPAYGNNYQANGWGETEGIHENLTQEEYSELLACENCDEID